MKKITVDLGRVYKVLYGIGKAAAVVIALLLVNEIAAQLFYMGRILLYLAQFVSKSTGA